MARGDQKLYEQDRPEETDKELLAFRKQYPNFPEEEINKSSKNKTQSSGY